MEVNTINVILLILGISVFTYIPRSLPMVYLSGKELPNWLIEWMKFIPAGIFAALICPGIFTDNGSLNLSFSNIELMAFNCSRSHYNNYSNDNNIKGAQKSSF